MHSKIISWQNKEENWDLEYNIDQVNIYLLSNKIQVIHHKHWNNNNNKNSLCPIVILPKTKNSRQIFISIKMLCPLKLWCSHEEIFTKTPINNPELKIDSKKRTFSQV